MRDGAVVVRPVSKCHSFFAVTLVGLIPFDGSLDPSFRVTAASPCFSAFVGQSGNDSLTTMIGMKPALSREWREENRRSKSPSCFNACRLIRTVAGSLLTNVVNNARNHSLARIENRQRFCIKKSLTTRRGSV